MLSLIKKLAFRLRRMSAPLTLVALVLAVFLGLGVLFLETGDDRALIPALLGFLWCLSLLALIHLFQSLDLTDAEGGAGQRLSRALRLSGYWLLAIVWLAVTVVVLMLSFRLGSIWIDSFS